MNKEKPILIELSIKIIIICLAAFVIGIFFVKDIAAYAKGLALGAIFSILKLKLMEITFAKAVYKNSKNAKAYAGIHYALRYILTGLVLVIGALEPSINLAGLIIAIVSMKFAAYWQGYKEQPVSKDGSVKFVEWDDDEESDF